MSKRKTRSAMLLIEKNWGINNSTQVKSVREKWQKQDKGKDNTI